MNLEFTHCSTRPHICCPSTIVYSAACQLYMKFGCPKRLSYMVLTKKLNILASHLMRGPGCKTPLPARDALNKKAELQET